MTAALIAAGVVAVLFLVLRRRISDEPTEDVSSLLVRPKPRPVVRVDDYPPVEEIEWVIDLAPPKGATMARGKILQAFDRFENVEIYGCPPDGRWTYVRAAGAPESFARLAAGVKLREAPTSDADLLEVQAKIENAAKLVGANATPREPVAAATARVRKIHALVDELKDSVAVLILAAGGPQFRGKTIWDVMLSLGLRWGDGDRFHWQNQRDHEGGDHLFSVGTTTAPGYFLRSASGRFDDLVFAFSIPRSPDPPVVFEAMLRAAEYAQKRLGGELLDGNRAPLDADLVRSTIRRAVDRLEEAGFRPGATVTLQLFRY